MFDVQCCKKLYCNCALMLVQCCNEKKCNIIDQL